MNEVMAKFVNSFTARPITAESSNRRQFLSNRYRNYNRRNNNSKMGIGVGTIVTAEEVETAMVLEI